MWQIFKDFDIFEKTSEQICNIFWQGMVRNLDILLKFPNIVPGIDLSQFLSQINPSDLGISPLNGDQFDK